MLLVDDDEPKIPHGGECRQARAEHDPRSPGLRREPVLEPRLRAERTMQAHHRHVRKACAHGRLKLRGQGNFRNQEQGLTILGQYGRDGMQIDFCFAASCDAEHKMHLKAVGIGKYRLEHCFLFRSQRGCGSPGGQSRSCRRIECLEAHQPTPFEFVQNL